MVWGKNGRGSSGDTPSSGAGSFKEGRLDADRSELDRRHLDRTESGRTGELNVLEMPITARGTQDGLVLRVDGRSERDVLWHSLRGFIQSRRSFVEGNQVNIEWVGEVPAGETLDFIRANVLRDFDIELINGGRVVVTGDDRGAAGSGKDWISKATGMSTGPATGTGIGVATTGSATIGSATIGSATIGRGPSLFGGLDAALDRRASESRGGEGAFGDADYGGSVPENLSSQGSGDARSSGARLGATPKVGWGAAVANWDDADARVVYGTLRSGQKVETEHSVLVFGDVNSGAEIVAGGDVVVLGNLRGVAHAGAYDETGGGRVIFALHLEPTQLRIGAVISRGMSGGSTPEIARVDGQGIVVEPYQAKGAPSGRRAA